MVKRNSEAMAPKPGRSRNSGVLLRGAMACLAIAAAMGGEPAAAAGTGAYAVTVSGEHILVDGKPFAVKGLRLSNALISDKTTDALVSRGLDIYRSYGVNTLSVYVMGSRAGNVKGYRPDGSLDPVYARRLARIIEAAEARGMIVLVGCLYWGGSTASSDLAHWTQADAERAVANTAKWLRDNNYRNVFIDPDNEGMAHDRMGFDIGELIAAAHAAHPAAVMAYNHVDWPPDNADILIHFSPPFSPTTFEKPRPYLESEGTPPQFMTGVPYWGPYSRNMRADKYINIGIYTVEMREAQKLRTGWGIKNEAGYMLSSNWLQDPQADLANTGGQGTQDDPGIRWWLEYVRDNHPTR